MEEVTRDRLTVEDVLALIKSRRQEKFDMGSGDYAVERHEWQDKLTVEDVLAQIKARRWEKPE